MLVVVLVAAFGLDPLPKEDGSMLCNYQRASLTVLLSPNTLLYPLPKYQSEQNKKKTEKKDITVKSQKAKSQKIAAKIKISLKRITKNI